MDQPQVLPPKVVPRRNLQAKVLLQHFCSNTGREKGRQSFQLTIFPDPLEPFCNPTYHNSIISACKSKCFLAASPYATKSCGMSFAHVSEINGGALEMKAPSLAWDS